MKLKKDFLRNGINCFFFRERIMKHDRKLEFSLKKPGDSITLKTLSKPIIKELINCHSSLYL
ncbi:hypothetical protein CBW18_20895 [Pedobacter sp. AJM]|nr:hypothetical protein CBW18_20895 [Pedobacter sp. AJM]